MNYRKDYCKMRKNNDFLTVSTVTAIITWILILGLSFTYYTNTQLIILSLLLGASVLLYLINTKRQKQSRFIAIFGILLNLVIFISSTYPILNVSVSSIFLNLFIMNVLFWGIKIMIIVLNFAFLLRMSFELWFGKIQIDQEVEHE